jgi:dipeptidyl-peptidase-4
MAFFIATNLDTSFDLDTSDRLYVPNDVNVIAPTVQAVGPASSTVFSQDVVIDGTVIANTANAIVLEDNAELAERLAALDLGDTSFFRVAARDGLELDGFMLRPPGFDPNGSYPLLFYVYGEVAGQTVRDRWAGDRNLWHLLMTQRGYVVVSIDNRGTPSLRGRDWRKSLYGGIGVLSSRDQYDGLQALLERHDYLDPERIGIWGHSGGGSMTLNMLFRYPDAYHVGVSRAPVADQRLYDAIYQERYSGLLDEHAEGYVQGSPITHAAGLEGKLLLIHGTGDDNVHYQNAERLIDELVRLNKPFDFMAYPNRRHGIRAGEGTELHLYSTQTRYFDEHLKGAE